MYMYVEQESRSSDGLISKLLGLKVEEKTSCLVAPKYAFIFIQGESDYYLMSSSHSFTNFSLKIAWYH